MPPIASKSPFATKPVPTNRATPLDHLLTAPTTHNQVSFDVTPDASRQALLRAIASARRSFYIETFIWHDDAAGNAIIEALAARKARATAAGQPFEIKVLIDWVGLHDGAGDPNVIAKLRAIGAEVRVFSPCWIDFKDRLIAPITHRKLYIRDGSEFITGGRNIGDEYLDATYRKAGKPAASWRDLLYSVTGDETGRVREAFLGDWQRAGGTRPKALAPVVPASAGAKIQSIVTNPYTGAQGLMRSELQAIADARREIVAIYPYFSDDRLIAALIDTKRRNPQLRVKVIIPGTQDGAVGGWIYGFLNRRAARRLLQAGIEVREDGAGNRPFSHLKALLIDDRVLSIGSANADARSFEANCELNTLIDDPGTSADFAHRIAGPDWAAATPLSLRQLNAEPWWTRALERVLGAFDGLF